MIISEMSVRLKLMMATNQTAKIEIPVEAATAASLSDMRGLEAVGKLIDRLFRPGADDLLIKLFERTPAEAHEAGLTDAEVDAELAAYNAERRVC
jgi:hypothetical protein